MCEDSDRNKPESQHGYEIDDGSIAASDQDAREARSSPPGRAMMAAITGRKV